MWSVKNVAQLTGERRKNGKVKIIPYSQKFLFSDIQGFKNPVGLYLIGTLWSQEYHVLSKLTKLIVTEGWVTNIKYCHSFTLAQAISHKSFPKTFHSPGVVSRVNMHSWSDRVRKTTHSTAGREKLEISCMNQNKINLHSGKVCVCWVCVYAHVPHYIKCFRKNYELSIKQHSYI